MNSNNIVNEFNIGFFSTINNAINPIDLSVANNSEFGSFHEQLTAISSTPYTPSFSNHVQLDGVTFDENHNLIPCKITLEGAFAQESYENDEERDLAYKERELDYKKEVINDWLKTKGYDIYNSAELMKALLAKTEA